MAAIIATKTRLRIALLPGGESIPKIGRPRLIWMAASCSNGPFKPEVSLDA